MKTKLLLFLFCLFSLSILSPAQNLESRKIDSFGEHGCEALKLRSDSFISDLNKTPDTRGFIIVYEGNDEMVSFDRDGHKTIKQILPRAGEINYRIKVIRGMLKFLHAPFEKIKIMNGGYRQNFTVEFWIVPPGAEKPQPTPTLDKIKYRKGKPPAKNTYWNC